VQLLAGRLQVLARISSHETKDRAISTPVRKINSAKNDVER
jgi:hypothetical protein